MAVTWTTEQDVVDYLGPQGPAVDDDLVVQVTAEANAWCYRARYRAGYTDGDWLDADADPEDEATAPDVDVKGGVTRYAAMLWRERSGYEGLITFDGEVPPGPGQMGRIRQLLGLDLPAVT